LESFFYTVADIEVKVVSPLMAGIREGEAALPSRGTPGAAGYDLVACIEEPVVIAPGEVRKVGTGLAISIRDPRYAVLIYPRSGLGINKGLVLANGVAVIDSDYQGEIVLGLWNRNHARRMSITVNPGDRVAQMLIQPVVAARFRLVPDFGQATQRGEGGLGSTGTA
jgi:dUTP pyrophosphatase